MQMIARPLEAGITQASRKEIAQAYTAPTGNTTTLQGGNASASTSLPTPPPPTIISAPTRVTTPRFFRPVFQAAGNNLEVISSDQGVVPYRRPILIHPIVTPVSTSGPTAPAPVPASGTVTTQPVAKAAPGPTDGGKLIPIDLFPGVTPPPITQPSGGSQGGTAGSTAPPDPGQVLLGGAGGGDTNQGAGGGGTGMAIPSPVVIAGQQGSNGSIVVLGIIASLIAGAVWYFVEHRKKHGNGQPAA